MRQGQYLKIFLTGLTLSLSSFAFAQQYQQQPQQQQQGIQIQGQQQMQQQPQQSYQQAAGFNPAVLQGSWKSVCAPQGAFGPSNMAPNGANSQDIEYSFTTDPNGNPEIVFQVNTYANDPTCTSNPLEINTSKLGNYLFQGNNPMFSSVGRLSIIWNSCSGVDCHFYDPTVSAYSAPVLYLIYNVNPGGIETLNFATILPGGAILPAFRSPLVRPQNQLAGRR